MPARVRSFGMLVLLLRACLAHADALSTIGAPSPASTFTMEDWQTGAGSITDFRFLPDGRCVIVTMDGHVLVRPADGGALVTAGSLPVEVAPEKGILGLAVHPQFADNGQLFFYYSASDAAGGTDVARQRVVIRTLDAENRLSASETAIVTGLAGPANHNGGALEIGPDGLLYVGVGDSGCNSGTPPEPVYTPTNFYGTCLADHPSGGAGGNGKILRVTLDGGIPPTNPLVGATDVTACGAVCGAPIAPDQLGAPREDVWAWGFRNPFRLWIDPVTERVWVGDVGEVAYEEITIAEAGRHHGWPWREGWRGHAVDQCTVVRIGTTVGGDPIFDQDCVEPVYVCRHNAIDDQTVDGNCISITGGLIVDGCAWPDAFRGRYVFGDNSNRLLWTIAPTTGRDGIAGPRTDFGRLDDGAPVAFRTGPDGALYVAALPGRIVRIAPRRPVVCGGSCTSDVQCADDDPCTVDACDASSGQCRFAPDDGCPTPPCGPDGCDDGDPCTSDTCDDGTCRSTPTPGPPGVACVCARVPLACGDALPTRVARRRDRACAQATRIDGTAVGRARRQARKATKRFRRAAATSRRASGRTLDPACAAALGAQMDDAAARLAALRRTETR